MQRNVRQKVVGAAAVAAVLAAGSVAAVSATGHSNVPKRAHAHRAHRASSRDLAAAASYLGLSTAQLEAELGSQKSLAQIADATSGKSAAGLTQALIAAHKAKLAAAAARVPRRVAAEVNRAGGPADVGAARPAGQKLRRAAALFATSAGPGEVAARYIGLGAKQLEGELQAGRTLAQVAEAAPGKSAAGLIAALTDARRARVERGASAGRVPAARKARRLARLPKRVDALVHRQFAGG
jgi:hypothetical protein